MVFQVLQEQKKELELEVLVALLKLEVLLGLQSQSVPPQRLPPVRKASEDLELMPKTEACFAVYHLKLTAEILLCRERLLTVRHHLRAQVTAQESLAPPCQAL